MLVHARLSFLEATPKSIQYMMNVKGLNHFHVKSHLQKFRQGRQTMRYWNEIKKNDKSASICGVPVGSSKPLIFPRVRGNGGISKGKAKANEQNQGILCKQMQSEPKMLCNASFGGATIASRCYTGENPPTVGTSATIPSQSYFGKNHSSTGIGATMASGRYFVQNPTHGGINAYIPSGSYFRQNPTNGGNIRTIPAGNYLRENPASVGFSSNIPGGSFFGQNSTGGGIKTTAPNGNYFWQNASSIGYNATTTSGSYIENSSGFGTMPTRPTFFHNQLNTYDACNSMEVIQAHASTSTQQQHRSFQPQLAACHQVHFPSVMLSASSSQRDFNENPGQSSRRSRKLGNDLLNPYLNFDGSATFIQDNNDSSFNYKGGAGTSK